MAGLAEPLGRIRLADFGNYDDSTARDSYQISCPLALLSAPRTCQKSSSSVQGRFYWQQRELYALLLQDRLVAVMYLPSWNARAMYLMYWYRMAPPLLKM